MLDKFSRLRPFIEMAVLAASACGGHKPAAATPGYTKIDDMEGAGGAIAWPPPPGMKPGFWWSATSCAEAGRIAPLPFFADPYGWSFAALDSPHETMPGVLSAHAARLRTTAPLTGTWGANMGVDLAEQPDADGGLRWPPAMGVDAGAPAPGRPCVEGTARDFSGGPVDLGAYAGLTFWAMASPGGRQVIRVMLSDRNTDPRGGVCNAADTSKDGDCDNGFFKTLVLTDTFAQYRVDFSELKQDLTWGYRPNPDVLDLQNVYLILFQVDQSTCAVDPNAKCAGPPAPVSFDFWIDDLYFVNTSS